MLTEDLFYFSKHPVLLQSLDVPTNELHGCRWGWQPTSIVWFFVVVVEISISSLPWVSHLCLICAWGELKLCWVIFILLELLTLLLFCLKLGHPISLLGLFTRTDSLLPPHFSSLCLAKCFHFLCLGFTWVLPGPSFISSISFWPIFWPTSLELPICPLTSVSLKGYTYYSIDDNKYVY